MEDRPNLSRVYLAGEEWLDCLPVRRRLRARYLGDVIGIGVGGCLNALISGWGPCHRLTSLLPGRR